MAKKATTKQGLFTQVIETEKGKVFFGDFKAEPTTETIAVTKNDVTKHYDAYEELSGKLDDCYVYKKDIGAGKFFEMLVVNLIDDKGQTESVSVAFDIGYSAAFIQRLDNIKRGEIVTLKVFNIHDKEKSAAKGKPVFNKFLIPYQNGVAVVSKFKPEFAEKDTEKKKNLNKNVLPKFVEIKTKENGKDKISYNNDDYKEALRDIVKANNAAYKVAHEAEIAAEKLETPFTDEINEDFTND